MSDRFCLQMVSCDEGCGAGNGNGNDSTPVGTVISYMGTKAPKHYMVCDGAIYNIADYEGFSQFIKDEFGSFDFFGGDGTTTFAVPDLRGEFLRGAGTAVRDTGTGAAAGVHQDATSIPYLYMQSNTINVNGGYGDLIRPLQEERLTTTTNTQGFTLKPTVSNWQGLGNVGFTTRPTNTAVLYCIKYE